LCSPQQPLVVDKVFEVNISYGKLKEKVLVRNYDDLVEIIPKLFDKLAFTDFEITLDKLILTDHNFAQRVISGCTIILESLSLPFSDYKEMAQVENYAQIAGLDDEILSLPDQFLIPKESSVLAAVVQELEARLEVFDLSETTECIMREFIGPVLVGAIRLLGADSGIKMRSEYKVVGKRGRGPLDYDLLFKLFHVIVCEAKNGKDVVDGIPQNTAQLVACREVLLENQRKRRKREDHSELDEALEKIPSFGIVSTGRSWVFLKYYKDVEENTWKLQRSVECHLPLAARIEDRTGLHDAVLNLLQIVAGVLHKQREEVLAFEARMSSKR
jgi:hypothetical protein